MLNVYEPQKQGQGVRFRGYKIPKKVLLRIEQLGLLNDERNRYLAAGSKAGLMQVAAKYAERGMLKMAAEVQKEAESL